MIPFAPNGPLPDGTVLLEASAGTGKTYAITHIVTRFVAERGVPIDALLVVTFTEAAAAELRERVRGRLRDAFDALDAELVPKDEVLATWIAALSPTGRKEAHRRLRVALDAFDTATISTIHGFCHRVLSRFAFESNADADVELVSNHTETLRHIVYDHLSRKMEDAPDVVAAERLRGKFGTSIAELLRLASIVAADPGIILSPPDPGYPEACDDVASASLLALRAAWSRERDTLRALIEEAVDAGALSRQKYNLTYLGRRFDAIDAIVSDEPHSEFETKNLPSLGRAALTAARTKKASPGLVARIDALEAPAALDAHLAARAALDDVVARWLLAFKHELALRVREELPEHARLSRTRTFDELLRAVRDATAAGPHTPLAEKIRGLYRVALIDEFQDTDPVQWAVFERVFHDARAPLWLIGDPKQSIYGFRGADLETYFRAGEGASARFALDTNHRSDAPLVTAVNHFFSRAAEPFDDARIAFTPVNAAHTAPRFEIDDSIVPPMLIRPHVPPHLARGSTTETRVADDIVALLDRDARIVREDGDKRRVGPGDIAVLVRSKREAKKLLDALRLRGVPAVLRIDESVFSTQEALDLLRFVQAIVEPSRVANLRASMASAMVGASAETIDALARDESALDAWLERYRRYAEIYRKDGFVRAARAAIEDFEVERRFLSMPGGERRITDLAHVIELTHVASVHERITGPALAAWLEARRAEGDDIEDDARRVRLDNDRNAVVLATMHKSKGLEYPVVFLPSLGAVAHDPARATTFDVRERDRRVLYLDPKHPDAPRTERERADLRELLRLAYVGLTRAKHMCVIHAQLPDGTMNRKRAFRSPIASLLLGTGEFEADFARTVATIAEHGDDEAFRAPFADVPKLVAVRGPRTQTRPPVARDVEDVGPLGVRTITRTPFVDTLYRFSSFTSVIAAGEAPVEAGQKDEAETNTPSLPRPVVEPHLRVALAGLPGGKNLGNLVHEVLEVLDFRAPETLDGLIGDRLGRYGVPESPYRQTLDAALRDMLETPLLADDPSFTLSRVARGDTLRELGFTFPVAGGRNARTGRASARAIAETFADHPRETLPLHYAARVAGLSSAPLRGFFHGSIDLVVRHAGRYYVVDYKTNNLGDAVDDYTPSRLTTAMMESHYPLQAHVYGVAMHRHLSRVLSGYDYDAHFGGFLYLFVRGMSAKTGASRGVYADRPPRAQIEALDTLLRDGEVSR